MNNRMTKDRSASCVTREGVAPSGAFRKIVLAETPKPVRETRARYPKGGTTPPMVANLSRIRASSFLRASSFGSPHFYFMHPSCRTRAKREKYPPPDDRSVALSQRRRCQYVFAPL